MKKKMNNKGFSLVELIIVIAIMAVLMVVLAPQLLRYAEKTRLQKDNSAISEIANAIKIACADEKILADVPSTPITFTADAKGNQTYTFTASSTDAFATELASTIGTVTTSSTTYQKAVKSGGAGALTITITKAADGSVTVSVDNFFEDTNTEKDGYEFK